MVRLRALQMKIDLLGLAEPDRVDATVKVTETEYDPTGMGAAMTNPKLRARILKIEEEISEHGDPTAE